MPRPVIISGLGPVGALGIGIDATWDAVRAGRTGIGPIQSFDAGAFDCRIAAEVRDFKISAFVPKTYRKATKVMARDIELAVAAADLAARDARLATKGTAEGAAPTYPPARLGANIGASLIACDLDELTSALAEARDADGRFDIHAWGRHGITQLTPLWLLKYLPNMLACHVTIIHDAQGPSNTITCAEASSGLSIGEALRVIQRGGADAAFCGGAESKLNPMAFLRRQMLGQLNTSDNDRPAAAVRPFCRTAAGTVVGEGGGIVILEALDAFEKIARPDARAYAQLVGFGASQSVHRESLNRQPDPQGTGIALAIRAALRDAGLSAEQIDMVVPFGSAVPAYDQSEAAALRSVFGGRLKDLPVTPITAMTGNCGAAAGGLAVCIAAKALAEQTIPPVVNCTQPIDGLATGPSQARPADLKHVLTYCCGLGGQNAALVLKRV